MKSQTTNTLLMIKPIAFGFNEQTAENNYFQQQTNIAASTIQEQALLEFNGMVDVLKKNDIDVIIIEDTLSPHTPDSIFPNNWISFHDDGTIALYPMYAENRRLERRDDILERMQKDGFVVKDIIDYSPAEKQNLFLEGTGSMILDRVNKVAYAALSERTDESLFLEFCTDFHFKPISFHAYQTVGHERLPVYHTNVMMNVGDSYAVVCLDSVDDEAERNALVDALTMNEKEIIEISEQQMCQFAGNMLQVENKQGERFLVMSETAYSSLTDNQIEKLNKHNRLIKVAIPTIEKQGGGSARCMIAEVFLPKQ